MRRPSLHSVHSLTGQSSERVRDIERRYLHTPFLLITYRTPRLQVCEIDAYLANGFTMIPAATENGVEEEGAVPRALTAMSGIVRDPVGAG